MIRPLRRHLGYGLTLALLAGCALSAKPGPIQFEMLQPGREAEQRGDYETAFNVYKSAADSGAVLGQVYLAKLYESGRGVPQDFAAAGKWYKAAADAATTSHS